MARLAVFDIDGTLTDTNAVDDHCFVQAVAEVLGLPAPAVDWAAAPHVTDSGILNWLYLAHLGRAPRASEVDATLNRFIELLRAEAASAPDKFRPVAGSTSALPLIGASWDIALATGAWQASAQLKLSQVGLALESYSFASGSDATERADIVRLAVQRSELRAMKSYARIVSVGDAPWDVRTAAELQLPFVGIATGNRAARLKDAGATTILPDFLDLEAVIDALENAGIPQANEVSA